MSVYYMSLLKLSGKVKMALEKRQRDFLWEGNKGRKDHLVKWEDVCQSKEFDGSGIGHL